MKNILTLVTLLAFIMYWIVTLFFTFPNNPLSAKNFELKLFFDTHLSQRWDFFAPPPTSNDRLYFSYFYNDPITKLKKVRTFEVLEPIITEKRKKAPFNKKEDVMDYIVSGSVSEIQNSIKELYDTLEAQAKKNKFSYTVEDKNKRVIEMIERIESFTILSNYALLVAQNNQIPLQKTAFKITITNIAIPKFINKNASQKREEKIILSSNIHFLKL